MLSLFLFEIIKLKFEDISSLVTTLLSAREVWGSNSGSVKPGTVSPTVRQRCDVSSKLRGPGAQPRRMTPSLVIRFGVTPRAQC